MLHSWMKIKSQNKILYIVYIYKQLKTPYAYLPTKKCTDKDLRSDISGSYSSCLFEGVWYQIDWGRQAGLIFTFYYISTIDYLQVNIKFTFIKSTKQKLVIKT